MEKLPSDYIKASINRLGTVCPETKLPIEINNDTTTIQLVACMECPLQCTIQKELEVYLK